MSRPGAAYLTRGVLVCVLLACNDGSGGPGGVWDVPAVSRQIVRPWLYCTDCTDGELAQVTAKGAVLIPYLSAALLDGPTQADDSLAGERALEAVFRIQRYRARRGGVLVAADSSATVLRQQDVFRLTYRLRAAQALRTIDPLRAATDVAAFCHQQLPELQRQPAFKASFKVIGACP